MTEQDKLFNVSFALGCGKDVAINVDLLTVHSLGVFSTVKLNAIGDMSVGKKVTNGIYEIIRVK